MTTQEQEQQAEKSRPYLTRLRNPYPGLSQGHPGVKRISFDIPIEDERRLREVRLDNGTLILLVRAFARCVVQECRDQGWTFDDVEKFEDFIITRTQTSKEKERCENGKQITDDGVVCARPAESGPTGPRSDTAKRTGASRVRKARA